MQVTAEETYIAPSGQQRGRLCRRQDGRFQIVTEQLREPTDGLDAYWVDDHPPSGLFADRDDARAHLLRLLPGATALRDVNPCIFQLGLGPYPEPLSSA